MSKIARFFRVLFESSETERRRDEILSEKICHPDKFTNEHDVKKANEIFQLVTQNKGDYNKLLSLKERIYNELPVNKKDL